MAVCALTLVALAGSGAALAQQSPVPSAGHQARAGVSQVHDLERAFWSCDYTATVRGVHAAPVALCSAVIEELKNAKFRGDFGELLEWWRQHKPAVHEQLAEKHRRSTVEPVVNR